MDLNKISLIPKHTFFIPPTSSFKVIISKRGVKGVMKDFNLGKFIVRAKVDF